MMDENNLGVLSSENLNVKTVPENILSIYTPIIMEIYKFKETINLNEFLLLSEHLYSVKT